MLGNKLKQNEQNPKQENSDTSKSKNNRQLLFRNKKKKRGIEFSVYSDGLIVLSSISLSRTYGFRIPTNLFRFISFKISSLQNNQINANFTIMKGDTKNIITNVVCRLVRKINYFTGRDGKRKQTKNYYIKPVDKKQFLYLKDMMTENARLICELDNQFPVTSFFRFTKDLVLKIPSFDVLLSNSEIVVCGGLQNSKFEIYKDNQGFLLVKSNTSIYEAGKITISTELKNIISNITDFAYVLCSKNGEKLILVP